MCGSRKLVSVAVTNQLAAEESDFAVLQGWVHYHEVLARFGMRHWRGHGSPFENYTRDVGFPSLLSKICDTPEVGIVFAAADDADTHRCRIPANHHTKYCTFSP